MVRDAAGAETDITSSCTVSGSNVYTADSYDSTYTVVVYRDPPFTQPTEFVQGSSLFPSTFEKSLDRIVFQIQKLSERVSRVVKAKITDAAAELELPAKTERPNTYLTFDSSGNIETKPGPPPKFWNANYTYNVEGMIILHSGALWKLVVASDQGTEPGTDNTVWEKLPITGNWNGDYTFTSGQLIYHSGALWKLIAGSDKGTTPGTDNTVWEQVPLGGNWNANWTFALDDTCTYSGIVYKSLQASNKGHQPDTSPSWWDEAAAMSHADTAGDAGMWDGKRLLWLHQFLYPLIKNGTIDLPQKKILSPDAEAGDLFGYSVAISGDYAIVGAEYEDAGGNNAGAAYIFRRTGANTWDSGVKIVASDAELDDHFGYSVAISGDYAIVGAESEDAGGIEAGAAYIFRRTGEDTWDAGVKIVASDADGGDYFGRSVAISGDYAIVGAEGEDADGSNAGAAYIFRRTGENTWDAGVKIVASDTEAGDRFGYGVAISGDYAIVGAGYEDAGGIEAGAAYIFRRTGENTWDAGVKIVASDAEASDHFGRSVAISGDYAIVGAEDEDAGGSEAGAAYIFRRTGENTWDAGVKIVASDAEASDKFGGSVAISGDYAIVGAGYESASGSNAGAAYIYAVPTY
jgi:hypothetical protein